MSEHYIICKYYQVYLNRIKPALMDLNKIYSYTTVMNWNEIELLINRKADNCSEVWLYSEAILYKEALKNICVENGLNHKKYLKYLHNMIRNI